jgi:hypothetical protein
MSKDDKNELVASSVLVLVMVKNESSSAFWSVFGVPFKSRIYTYNQRGLELGMNT